MRRTWLFLAVAATLVLQAPRARGQATFLSHMHEVPEAQHPLGAAAIGHLSLSLDQNHLQYSLHLIGLDLEPVAANRTDPNDVVGIHLHFIVPGQIGPHILNIFGTPAEEDADLSVDYANETLSGVFDVADASTDPATGQPYPQFFSLTTKIIDDWIDELLSNQLYLAVHTAGENGGPLLHGDVIRTVPEPGTFLLSGGAMATILASRWRSRWRRVRKRPPWRRVAGALALVLFAGYATPASAQSSINGQWSSVQTWPVEAIHVSLLPTGKVMFWQTWSASLGLWDPVTQQFSTPQNPPSNHNIFCSGHAWLADGRLLVAGGHVNNALGSHRADIYNPFTNTWANNDSNVPDVPTMGPYDPTPTGDQATSGRRWYPSATTLGNGDVLVLSGTVGPVEAYGRTNRRTQVYRASTNTWQTLSGALRPASDLLPEYPRTFLAPDGRVVSLADFSNDTEFVNLTGDGSWTYLSESLDGAVHNYGSAVMYDAGKIANFGGGDPPSKNIALLDLNQPSPQWSYAPQDMAIGRRQHNATILADGTVLITGGSSKSGFNDPTGFVPQAEVWDPVTMAVTPVASASSIFRGYHSTAVLLPDGRVLVTGGNHDDATGYVEQRNAEIYSPAYLFNGARPTVTAAPEVVELGDTIFVQTPDAADIAKALMIVPGSVTHAQNWTQRANLLDFAVTEGGVNIDIPASGNEAPPGYYMLFLVNSAGVPSIAEWVRAEVRSVAPDNADFDENGHVDGADFLAWQRRAGGQAGATHADGDANDDGLVDSRDLAVWQAQFGETPAMPAEAAIPEPHSLGLALLSAAALAAARKRKGDILLLEPVSKLPNEPDASAFRLI